MSKNASIVKNPSASNNATRPVGRPPVVLTAETWEQVTDALASKSNLSVLADTAMVSVPTMRKLLAEKYGNRVQFERGRNGGVTLVAARGRKRKGS
jgi:hypothetical protein